MAHPHAQQQRALDWSVVVPPGLHSLPDAGGGEQGKWPPFLILRTGCWGAQSQQMFLYNQGGAALAEWGC